MTRILALLAALLPILPAMAAGGWRTVAPAIMYDAPSREARPMLIFAGGFPLSEVSRVHDWYKVASYNGDIGWVAAEKLAAVRNAIIVVDRAAVRAEPHPAALAVFFARRGVVLEVLRTDVGNGWMKVLHQDGEVGYLRRSDSWRNF